MSGAPERVGSTLRDDTVARLSAWDPIPGRQARLKDRFLTHLDQRPDGMERACLPDHVTAGVLVLSADLDHVLLNLHRKAGRWFHFGGHCERDDRTVAGAALREGLEESGLTALELDPVPVHLDEHEVAFCHPGVTVHHLDVRFTALAPTGAIHHTSAESIDVRWWPVAALPDDLDDDMHELVATARARWSSGRDH